MGGTQQLSTIVWGYDRNGDERGCTGDAMGDIWIDESLQLLQIVVFNGMVNKNNNHKQIMSRSNLVGGFKHEFYFPFHINGMSSETH